jgi:hypothetical protein
MGAGYHYQTDGWIDFYQQTPHRIGINLNYLKQEIIQVKASLSGERKFTAANNCTIEKSSLERALREM